jgi:putative tryptophan/tyrosine transport system substrate-binding protein
MQFDQVKRREFISLVGGTVPAWLLAARAQQAKMPVIGYFSGQSPDYDTARLAALRRSPSEACYVEGESIATEYRWVEGPAERYFGIAGAGRQDIWEHRHHE